MAYLFYEQLPIDPQTVDVEHYISKSVDGFAGDYDVLSLYTPVDSSYDYCLVIRVYFLYSNKKLPNGKIEKINEAKLTIHERVSIFQYFYVKRSFFKKGKTPELPQADDLSLLRQNTGDKKAFGIQLTYSQFMKTFDTVNPTSLSIITPAERSNSSINSMISDRIEDVVKTTGLKQLHITEHTEFNADDITLRLIQVAASDMMAKRNGTYSVTIPGIATALVPKTSIVFYKKDDLFIGEINSIQVAGTPNGGFTSTVLIDSIRSMKDQLLISKITVKDAITSPIIPPESPASHYSKLTDFDWRDYCELQLGDGGWVSLKRLYLAGEVDPLDPTSPNNLLALKKALQKVNGNYVKLPPKEQILFSSFPKNIIKAYVYQVQNPGVSTEEALTYIREHAVPDVKTGGNTVTPALADTPLSSLIESGTLRFSDPNKKSFSEWYGNINSSASVFTPLRIEDEGAYCNPYSIFKDKQVAPFFDGSKAIPDVFSSTVRINKTMDSKVAAQSIIDTINFFTKLPLFGNDNWWDDKEGLRPIISQIINKKD